MCAFNFKIAGGGGFSAVLETVQDIRPHKKSGKAVVMLRWGGKHSHVAKNGLNEIVAVGDWRKLRKRWLHLCAAG